MGFKGFEIAEDKRDKKVSFEFEGKKYEIGHGSVVIAAITSCTNTSNPSVMIGSALVAKKAVEKGLSVNPFVKTSLAPGSGVVTEYLKRSNLLPELEKLRFNVVGYGCTTCIGNSGPLPQPVVDAIEGNDLVSCAVLSGNRNFEGRVHPHVRANYLASPLLVVAYAIAGTVNIDFTTDPLGFFKKIISFFSKLTKYFFNYYIGKDKEGNPVFLKDILPTSSEISEIVEQCVIKDLFAEVYSKVTHGTDEWNALKASNSELFPWDENSTYIHSPPFFKNITKEVQPQMKFEKAYCLLNLGDSITTDHISPAGNISRKSPSARYLESKG